MSARKKQKERQGLGRTRVDLLPLGIGDQGGGEKKGKRVGDDSDLKVADREKEKKRGRIRGESRP